MTFTSSGTSDTVSDRDGEVIWSVGDKVEVSWDDTNTWWVDNIISVDDIDN